MLYEVVLRQKPNSTFRRLSQWIFQAARTIDQFDVDLYFKLVEKITVYDARLVISLLDGAEVDCEI